MKQKWFWGTFAFLLVFAFAVVSWALISSSLRFDPQIISHTENDLNGQTQKTDIWINQGRLTDLLPLILEEWTKENWEPVGKGVDLTSALLGSAGKEFDFSDQLQIKVFQKDGLYRTLGLLQAKETDATYGMTSDFPKIAFDPKNAKSNWNFPIPPPTGNQFLFDVKFQKMKMGLILLPPSEKPFRDFIKNCSDKGFTQTLLGQEKNKKVFLLTNKKNRILAIFDQEESNNCISLVSIN